ncbi:Gfo/Idh/MocA family oxidoreductase [Paenibacillus antri]|uniref:Gfo/Idh/MocA family oxidoreductase n=1 Tax=Paenibacillus antri TaxID=2582848 RepID=A0A5R9GKB5_9BACL|nr:Gfo/Idh/MocA family oxidoreductase [Paenibacillus antri]TLS53918.1 Gfo/Idh/MocA family oxidoreductase [Paenibacillus antri]
MSGNAQHRKTVRWGILGCAQIAVNAIIPALQAAREAEIAAVASRDEAKARSVAERFGIPKAYGGYEALLADPEIDAVYIPLPNHLHLEWTVKAAEAGKHVLCEKPFAMNAAEAEAMAEACGRNGVKLAEAFMYRYHPRYDLVRDIVRSGEIGDIRGVQVAFTFQIEDVGVEGNIRMDGKLGGGAIYDVGCYTVSGARLVLGAEPEAATAIATYLETDPDVDMMVSGLLEFPGGIGLSFQCGMSAELRNSLQIAGTKGRIDIPEAYVPSPESADFFVVTKGERRKVVVPVVDAYELQVAEFSRCILEDAPTRFDPADAVRNMAVLDAVRASAKERRRVSL